MKKIIDKRQASPMCEINLKQPVLTLASNIKGRDYFVGDLHGHYSSFVRGLETINFNPEADRLFSVGDLVDRGPDSLACLRLLHEDWFYCVAGNHERTFYQYVKYNDATKNLENGWQFRLSKDEREECIALVEKMHWAITIASDSGSIGIVHADVPEGMVWTEFCHQLSKHNPLMIRHATWSRKRISHQLGEVPEVDWVFVGHQCQEVPQQLNNVICIDTGVYIPGRYCKTYGLTFAFIEEGRPDYVTLYNQR